MRRLNLFDLAIAARIIFWANSKAIRRLCSKAKSLPKETGIMLNASSWGSSDNNSFLIRVG